MLLRELEQEVPRGGGELDDPAVCPVVLLLLLVLIAILAILA